MEIILKDAGMFSWMEYTMDGETRRTPMVIKVNPHVPYMWGVKKVDEI